MTRTQRQIEEFRKADAHLQLLDARGRPHAFVPVSIEQESHAFRFGCVAPDLARFAEADRARCQARMDEVFNYHAASRSPLPSETTVARVELARRVPLGQLRRRLEMLPTGAKQVQVNVWGAAVGLTDQAASTWHGERAAGRLLADLYSLCFAHPAINAIVWNGFVDGEPGVRGGGLLRPDFAPKFAFKVLQKLIGFDWHSRASGLTDPEGRCHFRGFFGDYRVVANLADGHLFVTTLNVAEADVAGESGKEVEAVFVA